MKQRPAPRYAGKPQAGVASPFAPKPSMGNVKTIRSGAPAGGDRYAATNMGPKGFTDAQKGQINKRLKAKVIKST
jgi:hypothetical protein